jgi:hypothetical protein
MEHGNRVRRTQSQAAICPTRMGRENRGCQKEKTGLRRSVISRKYHRRRRAISNAGHHSPSNTPSVKHPDFISHSSTIAWSGRHCTYTFHLYLDFLQGIHSQYNIPLRSIYCTAQSLCASVQSHSFCIITFPRRSQSNMRCTSAIPFFFLSSWVGSFLKMFHDTGGGFQGCNIREAYSEGAGI